MYAIQPEYFSNIEVLIDEIKRKSETPIVAAHLIIELLETKITELHLWLENYSFDSIEEEIFFFKKQKPLLISQLIYYSKVIEIESNLPSAKESKLKYLKKEINKISLYEKTYRFFHQYYRSNSFHNDQKYFTRYYDKKLNYFECHIINYNPKICTPHDYNVAQIMANDLLIIYLEEKMEALNSKQKIEENTIKSPFHWTGTRIELVELIYAVHAQKVFNNGNADIKEIAECFGQIFNINIEEGIYRSYLDIKARKTERTKFLNSLIETLNNKIQEEEF